LEGLNPARSSPAAPPPMYLILNATYCLDVRKNKAIASLGLFCHRVPLDVEIRFRLLIICVRHGQFRPNIHPGLWGRVINEIPPSLKIVLCSFRAGVSILKRQLSQNVASSSPMSRSRVSFQRSPLIRWGKQSAREGAESFHHLQGYGSPAVNEDSSEVHLIV
jgi:hypothetical protein